jgi:8-oxo-dGTP pyrophosphatase MutT (NUDIX family)
MTLLTNSGRRGAWLPMQVAAVCYRITRVSVEFLLVNTSGGKWTFPKGRIDPNLSGSEAAAREALEEAGVKGRIEEVHFDCYVDTKRSLGHDAESREILIAAYLLEVSRLNIPEELHRNPTWFAAHEAKSRLAERRSSKYSQELVRIIDGAVSRLTAPDVPPLVHGLTRQRGSTI